MFKKLLVVALFACLLPMVAGCGRPRVRGDITVWHWMTDRQAAFDALTQKYYEKTGLRVVFEVFAPEDVYRSRIQAAASGRLLPDIFSPQGDRRELAAFINAGFIANLTEYMNDGWKDMLFERALQPMTFEEDNQWGAPAGIYGVPLDVNSLMLYFNKDLFRRAGLDPYNPPQTWTEFIEAGRALRAAGIQPFVSGFGEGWLINAFATSYKWNLFGREGVLGLIDGTIPYTDPRYVRVLQLFEEMRNHRILASGIVTMVNKDAERVFATERAAMAFNGSWGINVYNSMNPNLNFSVMPLPRLEEGRYPMLKFGGEGSSLFVNEQSPKRDESIAFLRWLTEPEQQAFLARETLNIPSNKEVAEDLPPLLKIFSEHMAYAIEPLPRVEAWQVVNFININLQSIIIGERTPEVAAREIQAEKNRQAARAARRG
ncbi:MAG: extracellular solute-binding protein [Elusimicrobia bacterium]|nr:extracellular solute-binding protein [Elusimicrobiota bacterium]